MSTLHQYTRDGLTFDVTDAGPRDGEVVVLLHGFPQDRTAWDAVAPLLHDAGLRTLAPDQRGYSPAASPRGLRAYRVPQLVQDVVALMNAVEAPRVHLVGHDWGGSVAWTTALRAPHRLASLTVLSTPHPTALQRALHTPDQARRSWYMGAFQVPALPERVLSRSMHHFLTGADLPAGVAERYARRFARPESLRGPIDWYRANLLAAATGADTRGVDRVQVPTTYVWGSQDVALGRTAAELSGEYVDADYRFVELAASHWLPEVEPERVAQEIVARVG